MDLEIFLNCLKSITTEVNDNTIIYIKNNKNAKKFLNELEKSDIPLGMDFYDGTCSGDIKIRYTESENIKVIAKDNGSDEVFKFRSIIIILNNISDNDCSPTILFEADDDLILKEKYESNGYPCIGSKKGIYLELEFDDRIEIDKNKIEEYLQLEYLSEYDEEIYIPKSRRRTRHVNGGICMYVNLQQCDKHVEGNRIIAKYHELTSEILLNLLKEKYMLISL